MFRLHWFITNDITLYYYYHCVLGVVNGHVHVQCALFVYMYIVL